MKLISFLIPVFRNEGSLFITYSKIVNKLQNTFPNYDYEIIFVDDGSDDDSLNELLKIREGDKKVKIISFSRNFGQVNAIAAGLTGVLGDAVIIMSADLQDPIELIENMIADWRNGNEIVICFRTNRDDGFFNNLTSKLFYWLIHLLNPKIPAGGFDYILLDKKAAIELNRIEEKNRFFQGDILWLGFKTIFIPYQRLQRHIGKSQWTVSKKIKYFIDGLLNSSYVPIRIMSFLGIFISFIGFLYTLLIIYNRIANNTPFIGWAPIMIAILIIGGLIMFMLGIIGEYIWRIYDESRKRPHYIIKEKHL